MIHSKSSFRRERAKISFTVLMLPFHVSKLTRKDLSGDFSEKSKKLRWFSSE